MPAPHTPPARGVYLEASVDWPPGGGVDGRRTFTGIAYSGEPLDLGFGRIAIDLASLAPARPCPVLLGHDRGQRVGVCTLSVDAAPEGGSQLRCAGRLLANAPAAAIAAEADDGFPWQLSVHAEPAGIEEIPPGAQIALNGRTLQGPLAVWRSTRIRELSFTPTGVDYRTSVHVLEAAPSPMINPSGAAMIDPVDTAPEVAALQAELTAANERAGAAEARAEAAEQALAEQRRSVRLAAVTASFGALGRQLSAEQAAPYLELPEATWERVVQDLQAMRPAAPEALFSAQAIAGAAPDDQRGTPFALPAGYTVAPEDLALRARVQAYLAAHPDSDFLAAVRAVTR